MDRKGILKEALMLLGILILAVLLITSCGTANAAEVPIVQTTGQTVTISASTITKNSDLTEAEVAPGDGVQTTIMKSCNCRLESFAGAVALVVTSNNNKMKFAVFGPWAFRSMGALDTLLVVHPGDIVSYGNESDVMEAIIEAGALNIIKVSGKYVPGKYILRICGGEILRQLYLIRLETEYEWHAFFDESGQGQKYSVEEGIRLAKLAAK